MIRRRTLKATAALSAVLFASACATSGGKTGAGTDQQVIADYSTEYAATGGFLGGLIGCGIGALANKKNRGQGCAVGGAVGALAGAGTGLYYARNQSDAASSRAAVAVDQDMINQELRKAQELTAAAERLVSAAHVEIASLKRQVSTGQASQEQLIQRVVRANQDRANLEKAAEKLRTQIQKVESDLRKGAYAQADVIRLKRASDVLRSQLAKLEQSIGTLNNDVSTAGV